MNSSARPLVYRIVAQGDDLYVTITGDLTEDVSFNNLIAQIDKKHPARVVFDVKDIQGINSCGLREWLLFLEKICHQTPFSFSRVGQAMAEQACIVASVLGAPGTRIDAVDAPFQCEKCSHLTTLTLGTADLIPEAPDFGAPTRPCPQCQSPMKVDGDPAEYFLFLKPRGRKT